MPKRYIGKSNDGGDVAGTGTSASGSVQHLLYKGPTLGHVFDYSGVVTGPVLYLVDNGPTLGLQYSAT